MSCSYMRGGFPAMQHHRTVQDSARHTVDRAETSRDTRVLVEYDAHAAACKMHATVQEAPAAVCMTRIVSRRSVYLSQRLPFSETLRVTRRTTPRTTYLCKDQCPFVDTNGLGLGYWVVSYWGVCYSYSSLVNQAYICQNGLPLLQQVS